MMRGRTTSARFTVRWHVILPPGTPHEVRLLLVTRGLRAVADGSIAILLPAYLLALGLGTFEVGVLSTATLLGSALATLAVGAWGHRFHHRTLLLGAALLMCATGLAFAGLSQFWPLLVVAFVGTLNPSSGDVSVFLPLEHARIAHAVAPGIRTAVFARYSMTGVACAAVGALAASFPDRLAGWGVAPLAALRLMFVLYGAVGLAVCALYARLPAADAKQEGSRAEPLHASRSTVIRLATLFSLDSFAGGFVITSLLSLWLLQRFDLSLTAAGSFFFWAGLLSAASQFVSAHVAQRIGLLNTMVFTHLPANACLILAAFAPTLPLALTLLFARSALSQMDVPARSAFVMAVVTPGERAAAASFTAVPRSLASALSPTLGGALLTAGWLAAPLVACGTLKIVYDLALLAAFRRVQAPDLKR
jgi:predicted MFS family arabinose efflux permease